MYSKLLKRGITLAGKKLFLKAAAEDYSGCSEAEIREEFEDLSIRKHYFLGLTKFQRSVHRAYDNSYINYQEKISIFSEVMDACINNLVIYMFGEDNTEEVVVNNPAPVAPSVMTIADVEKLLDNRIAKEVAKATKPFAVALKNAEKIISSQKVQLKVKDSIIESKDEDLTEVSVKLADLQAQVQRALNNNGQSQGI